MKPFINKLLKPLRKSIRYFTDTVYRQQQQEVANDLLETKKLIGKWAKEGAELGNPNKRFAILSFTNLPLYAKLQSVVAKTLQLEGYSPLIFTYKGTKFGHEYFKIFGINNFAIWEDCVTQYLTEHDNALIETEINNVLLECHEIPALLEYQFHNIQVGKHALSVVARTLIEGRLDLYEPRTHNLIRQKLALALQSTLVAERYFKEFPIEKMLVRDSGYIPNGPIYEVALNQGVDCIVYEQGQQRSSWIFKRYTRETLTQHYFSISSSTWKFLCQMKWTPEDDARVEAIFDARYKPDSTDDTRRLQSGKEILISTEVQEALKLDSAKKTAVIFSHLAWDATFFYGTCLFNDFEDWLYETVKFVSENCSEMNWIIKLHPFNAFKLQRESKSEESEMRLLRDLMPLPNHIKIMRADTTINTKSLFPLIDYVLTVNGTVGMEFPCLGIPAVIAGTGRYDGYGFTIEPKTREDYFMTLRQLHTLPRLSSKTQSLARRHFDALFRLRQFNLGDVAPVELKRLHEAQSNVHDNMHITAKSLSAFSNAKSIKVLAKWLTVENSPDLLGVE